MRSPTMIVLLLLVLPAVGARADALAPAAGSASAQAPKDTPDSPAANDERVAGLEYPVTLATFSTTLLGSQPERTANIRLAAAALDGQVIEPGERLSFNAVVGPRTLARGYQSAPVILHERRQVQTGGGICQVASTLFVAALSAGLTAVDRTRHSTPVDYIALGQDATIAWGAKDLVVRNDLDQRVRVRLDVLGSTLVAHVMGERESDATFELSSEVSELPAEPGLRPGREVTLWRVRREGGAEVSRELLHCDVFPSSLGPRPSSEP